MSESEHLPAGKSDEELAIESFVDSIKEIHPDLDREEFHETISEYVREATQANGGEEESESEEDE